MFRHPAQPGLLKYRIYAFIECRRSEDNAEVNRFIERHPKTGWKLHDPSFDRSSMDSGKNTETKDPPGAERHIAAP